MSYIKFQEDVLNELLCKMNSKTIYILQYLVNTAKDNNNEIDIKYKDIETALNIGHTCVGSSMRLLQNLNIIEKLSPGKYRINSDIFNITENNSIF